MTCPARIDVARTQRAGSLTIAGVLMHRPAFAVTDVTALWGPPPRRGSDLVIPGRPGVLAMPRRAGPLAVTLPLVLDGRFDHTGAGVANELAGIDALLEWLDAHVGPLDTGDGTRTATLTGAGTRPTRTGPVTVEKIEVGAKRVGGLWAAVLDLTVPAGVLAAA